MESAQIEYLQERKCKLSQVGGLLDSKGYGIATRKGTPYKTMLDQAILKLMESGVLHKLKVKWWKQKRGGGSCDNKRGGGGVNPLGKSFHVTKKVSKNPCTMHVHKDGRPISISETFVYFLDQDLQLN